MATTERRRSVSALFGLGKSEPRPDVDSDGLPKLRRKLQKVSKQVDLDGTDTMTPPGTIAAPAPCGGVETVVTPGDGGFLSTKYDSRPPLSRRGRDMVPTAAKDEKRGRRHSLTRFFSRSSSANAASRTPRSASCTRTSASTATAPDAASPRGECSYENTALAAVPAAALAAAPAAAPAAVPAAVPAASTPTPRLTTPALTPAPAVSSSYAHVSEQPSTPNNDAQAKAARALQLMEAHEKASAIIRRASQHTIARPESVGSVHQTMAARNKPQAQHLALDVRAVGRLTAAQNAAQNPQHPQRFQHPPCPQVPQFHRPYSPYRNQNMPLPPLQREMDAAPSPTRTVARHLSHAAPMAAHSHHVVPLSPTYSSAGSTVSSGSLSSPMSSAFSHSSASLSFSSASSVDQSYSAPPMTPPGTSTSCDSASPGACASRRDSWRGHPGSSHGRRAHAASLVSHPAHAASRDPPTPDSPRSAASSVDLSSDPSDEKPRRKMKTPVHEIGQLENSPCSDDASAKAAGDAAAWPPNVHTPPASPVFVSSAALGSSRTDLGLTQTKSSIECIAEEYRALLASRGSQSSGANADGESEGTTTSDVHRQSLRGSHGRGTRTNTISQPTVAGADALSSTSTPRKFMLLPSASASEVFRHTKDANGRCPDALLATSTTPVPTTTPLMLHTAMTAPLPPLPLRTRKSVHAQLSQDKGSKMASHTSPSPPHLPPSDNISLQICLDLLTRELSSAVTRRSSPAAASAATQRAESRRRLQQIGMSRSARGGARPFASTVPAPSAPDTAASALQILVMIEAYERLRDQVVGDARRRTSKGVQPTGSSCRAADDSETMEAMFGFWLEALYQIHDSLVSSSSASDDESDGLDNTSNSDYDSDGR